MVRLLFSFVVWSKFEEPSSPRQFFNSWVRRRKPIAFHRANLPCRITLSVSTLRDATDKDGGGTVSFSEYIQALVSFGLFDVVAADFVSCCATIGLCLSLQRI